jgi:CMP-N,N'-diacetyllegionaminic acid synthase
MTVLGVVIARGGSQRLPRKNLRLLGGKPLIAWSIEAACAARRLDHAIVSTDDEAIAEAARAAGGNVPFLRPAELARHDSTAVDVLRHAVGVMDAVGLRARTVVLLQATSPLRTAAHIDEALETFDRTGADSLTAVSPSPAHPYWTWTMRDGRLQPFFDRTLMSLDRAALPPAYIENGAIFVVRREVLDRGELYGEHVVPYMLGGAAAIDIDTAEDFDAAERIVACGGNDVTSGAPG